MYLRPAHASVPASTIDTTAHFSHFGFDTVAMVAVASSCPRVTLTHNGASTMPSTASAPDPAALLRSVPDNLWGLWTHGQFPTPADERAAIRWFKMAITEYPSVKNFTDDLVLGDTFHTQVCRWLRGTMTNEPIPRWVLAVYRALAAKEGMRLSPPEIKGDTPEAIRRRFRWVRLAYYDDFLSGLAKDIGVSRDYLSHFLSEPHRGLTPRLVDGMWKAGFRPDWVRTGAGAPGRPLPLGHKARSSSKNGAGSTTDTEPHTDEASSESHPGTSTPAPVQTRREVLDRLAGQRAALRALGLRRLGLFGSFRHDHAQPDSDVDLLVEFEPGATTLGNIMETAELLEAVLGRRVEIVPTDALSPYIGPKILADAEDVPITP